MIFGFSKGTLVTGMFVALTVLLFGFWMGESLVVRLLVVIFSFFGFFVVILFFKKDKDHSHYLVNYECRGSFFENCIVLVLGLFALFILVFFSGGSSELFQDPSVIGLSDWLQHACVVLLSSFLPGFFILRIIDRRKRVSGLAVIIVSFLLSVFSVFLVGYSAIIFGFVIGDVAFLFVAALNVILLGVWFFVAVVDVVRLKNFSGFRPDFKIKLSSIVFVVCILIIVFVGTYGLYGSHLIQDQRVHHGWALLYQDFIPVVDGKIDSPTPLVYPIYLATIFSLSNIPTANVVNSLNLLNALPLLGFYVLVREYFAGKKGLPELATFFAFFTGGVGWIVAKSNLLGVSGGDVAGVINDSWVKTYDVLTSDSFLFAGHPDITTPLLTIALPSMFMLVYFVTAKANLSNKSKYFLMFSISTVSLFSHPETLIIVLTLAFFFVYKADFKGNFVLLCSLLCVFCLDLLAPAQYYSLLPVSIFGNQISLLLVALVGVIGLFAVQFLRLKLYPVLKSTKIDSDFYKQFVFQLSMFVIFGYLFSFLVYSVIANDFNVWTVFGVDGSIPWYFYPMRLGVVGLLAIPALVYAALYWRNRRDSIIFIIWILVILVLGPFYKEYRMIKHLHVILAVFAALSFVTLIHKIPSKTSLQKALSIAVMASVIIVAIGSPLLYVEYVQTKEKDYGVLPGSVAPSDEEYEALSWLKQKLDAQNETVITLPRGTDNFLSKVVQYSGAWIVRTNLFYKFFELTDVEIFIALAQKTNLKYVYITADDKQTLEMDSKYANSYIKHLISILSPVFSNDAVEIFEIPKMSSSANSKLAVVLPINLLSSKLVPDSTKQYYSSIIEILALSEIEYSVITNYDLNLDNYETIILPYALNDENLKPYLSWAEQGNQLIILEPEHTITTNETELTWKVLKGTWNITDGKYIQSDMEKSSGLITTRAFNNCSVSASIHAIKNSSSDNHLGLIINYKNESTWDYVFLRNNRFVLYRLQNGVGTEVWSIPSTLIYNSTYSVRLDIQDFNINFYMNDVLVGTYTDTNTTNSGQIGFRTFNVMGEFQNLSVKTINQSVSTTDLVFIHENYQQGEIARSNIQLQHLLGATNSSISESIFTPILELLGNYEHTPSSSVISNDLAHINYAKGTIFANNSRTISSSLLVPASVVLQGTVEIYEYDKQNQSTNLTLVEKFDNVEISNLQTFGTTSWNLTSQNQSTISPGELNYFYVKPDNSFALDLELDTNSTINFVVNNTVLRLNNKHIVFNINKMDWMSTSYGSNPYFLLKTPYLSYVEEITFESAHLSKGIKNVFVKDEAVSLNGLISLNLQLADNYLTIISDLSFDGKIQLFE